MYRLSTDNYAKEWTGSSRWFDFMSETGTVANHL